MSKQEAIQDLREFFLSPTEFTPEGTAERFLKSLGVEYEDDDVQRLTDLFIFNADKASQAFVHVLFQKIEEQGIAIALPCARRTVLSMCFEGGKAFEEERWQ